MSKYEDIISCGYKIKNYMVPFSLIRYYNSELKKYINTKTKRYTGYDGDDHVLNFAFYASVKIDGISRGRSSTKIDFVNTENSEEYEMFPRDYVDMAQQNIIENGVIEGYFSFSKKGANFGLIWLGKDKGKS